VLAETLQAWLGSQKALGVCGVMSDKAADHLAKAMGNRLSHFIGVTPNTPRSLAGETVAEIFSAYCPTQTMPINKELIAFLKNQTQPVVIFGSLYLAGEILALWESF
jgi:folylpolyglutamate synthase/dihydropteroate synthase